MSILENKTRQKLPNTAASFKIPGTRKKNNGREKQKHQEGNIEK